MMLLPRKATELVRSFRQGAKSSPGQFSSIAHPELADTPIDVGVDILRFGEDNADTVVFLTAGIHGAELEAGTVCQLDLLKCRRFDHLPVGIAVVLIHAANPWGAAMSRRYTEENVDLCRNFVDFSRPQTVPLQSYDHLRSAIDAHPNDATEANLTLEQYGRDHGIPELYAAVMSGQYRDADGIGFGGHGPTWARQTLEGIMVEHASTAKRIYAVDYHTGVGPYGYGSIIAMQQGARLEQAHDVFGDWVIAPRGNPPPGFVDVTGHSTDGYEALFPNADVMAAVLEVGTFPQEIFLERLLSEHRLTHCYGADSDHPDLTAARGHLVDFFIPNDAHWHAYLLHRGRQVFDQVLEDAVRERG